MDIGDIVSLPVRSPNPHNELGPEVEPAIQLHMENSHYAEIVVLVSRNCHHYIEATAFGLVF